MSDNKKEITSDILIADTMLRLTALERLLLDKQVFSRDELVLVTEDIAKQVSKIILEKAQVNKTVESIMQEISLTEREKEQIN